MKVLTYFKIEHDKIYIFSLYLKFKSIFKKPYNIYNNLLWIKNNKNDETLSNYNFLQWGYYVFGSITKNTMRPFKNIINRK